MIGKKVSHYEITGKLGEGGMGVVYEAYDTVLKRKVALKFLPADLTRDEESRKRFVREAQAGHADRYAGEDVYGYLHAPRQAFESYDSSDIREHDRKGFYITILTVSMGNWVLKNTWILIIL